MNYTNLKTIAIIAEAVLRVGLWRLKGLLDSIVSCCEKWYWMILLTCRQVTANLQVFLSEIPRVLAVSSAAVSVHLGDQGVPEQQTRDIIKVAEQKGVGRAWQGKPRANSSIMSLCILCCVSDAACCLGWSSSGKWLDQLSLRDKISQDLPICHRENQVCRPKCGKKDRIQLYPAVPNKWPWKLSRDSRVPKSTVVAVVNRRKESGQGIRCSTFLARFFRLCFSHLFASKHVTYKRLCHSSSLQGDPSVLQ